MPPSTRSRGYPHPTGRARDATPACAEGAPRFAHGDSDVDLSAGLALAECLRICSRDEKRACARVGAHRIIGGRYGSRRCNANAGAGTRAGGRTSRRQHADAIHVARLYALQRSAGNQATAPALREHPDAGPKLMRILFSPLAGIHRHREGFAMTHVRSYAARSAPERSLNGPRREALAERRAPGAVAALGRASGPAWPPGRPPRPAAGGGEPRRPAPARGAWPARTGGFLGARGPTQAGGAGRV